MLKWLKKLLSSWPGGLDMAQIKLADLISWTKCRLLKPVWLSDRACQDSDHRQDDYWRQYTSEPDQPLSRYILSDIITDTRAIQVGCLFVALKGARFDGHDFILQALAKGAAAVMADDVHVAEVAAQMAEAGWQEIPLLVVPDTLAALQQIAAGYRRQLPADVVAISGSVGKTTTRELIYHSLKRSRLVHQTQGNLNNEIGLPQTILQAAPHHDLMLLEMGMRGPGEIRLLSQIAAPDIAVLTQIGWSHIERLGSQEAIFQAKAEIADGLRPSGWLVLNGDDPWLEKMASQYGARYRIAGFSVDGRKPWPEALIWLSADQVHQSAEHLSANIKVYHRRDKLNHLAGETSQIKDDRMPGQVDAQLLQLIESESIKAELPVAGLHLVRNLMAALSVAVILDVPLNEAIAGAADYQPVGNRQRILKLKDLTVMDDSYNASPESMIAALETLAVMAGENHRLVAVLGDMLELGDFANEAHAMTGRRLAQLGYDALFCLGQLTPEIASAAQAIRPEMKICCCTQYETLIQAVDAWLKPGDYVLIKGSRGLQMERVSAYLQTRPHL